MDNEARLVDAIVQPLYDTNPIPAAGSVLLSYFTVPIGAGQSSFAAAGVPKSISDTNLNLASQLSGGYNFNVLGFRIQPSFLLGITAAAALPSQDINTWSFGAVFTFQIASKVYLQCPVDTIPAGMGPSGFAAFATTAAGTVAELGSSHGVPHLSNGFNVGKKPLRLSQTQTFFATIAWPLAIANTTTTPGAVAEGIPLRVYLDGFYYRPVQ
jgi:hypothetical protein